MKIFEKVLWAIDLEQDLDISIQKIGLISKQLGNSIILLHILPTELEQSSFRNKVEKSLLKELEEVKVKLQKICSNEISTKLVFGNVVDSIIDLSIEENVNSIFINSGSTKADNNEKLGLNALKVIRFSRKPVVIFSNDILAEQAHVVCSVDFSEPSSIALKDAILHAKETNAILDVISVFEPIEVASRRLVKMELNADKENAENLEKYKTEFENFLKDFNFLDVEYKNILLVGDPHIEIVKYANQASVLYIGSSGKSGLHRIFMGSVAEEVAKQMPCNVVYIKSEEVFKLKIPHDISDLETFFTYGNKLVDLGFYEEAIEQYKECLNINDMHLPSVTSLSKLYKKLENNTMADYYINLHKTILEQLTNWKIQEEIRRNASF